MFSKCRNIGNYNKGQVFPFLIAMLVAVLAVAMITVNLGQIGIFKTDVSNAADAGALAGASTLSGYLLGIGLQSDKMCGEMIIAAVVIILTACSVIGIPVAIATYIAITVKQFVTYFQALEEGKMAWSNAKKTALQYAFQNAGIDEPRPTFKQFLKNVYGISDPDTLSAQAVANYNKIYALGDDASASTEQRRKIKSSTQTGFSRFMEGNWFWDEGAWGEIEPGNISPAIVTNGYAWNADGSNSYDSGNSNLKSFENYVQVSVMGNIMYPLEMYNPGTELSNVIRDWVSERLDLPWWLDWLADAVQWVIDLSVGMLEELLPAGLKMNNIVQNTDNNPVTVTVKRYKQNNNLGLWVFRYGVVQGQSSAHAYGETDADGIPHDIKPMLFENIAHWIGEMFSGGDWDFQWFNTGKHLFETELMTVR